jgi:hypothetical protein
MCAFDEWRQLIRRLRFLNSNNDFVPFHATRTRRIFLDKSFYGVYRAADTDH